jgi:hypothetical protein
MSKLINQLLMLSGFYFILSFVLNTWKNDIINNIAIGLLVVFVLLFVILCFKKNFGFLEKFDNNNPKVSNYLKAVGGAQYFNIIFGMLPGFFVKNQIQLPVYFKYASIAYLVLLFGSLIYVTYINFFKRISEDKSVKKTTKKAPAKKVKE